MANQDPDGHIAKLHRRRNVSLSVIFVLLTVVHIGGATGFAWGFTYLYALRNIRDLAGQALEAAKRGTVSELQAFLDKANLACMRAAGEFESGRLSTSSWRENLESLVLSLGNDKDVAAVSARFLDAENRPVVAYAAMSCSRSPSAPGCSSAVVGIINATQGGFYASDRRGQPLKLLGTVATASVMSGLAERALGSSNGTAWNDLYLLPLSESLPPLERNVVERAVAFVPRAPIGSTPLQLLPGERLPDSAGPDLAADAGGLFHRGAAAVAVSVGTLSRFLKADPIAQNGVIVITTASRFMVASSTADERDLLDAHGRPLAAASSPSPLVRTLVSQTSSRELEAGRFGTFAVDGHTYYYSREEVAAFPGLAWTVAVAVAEDWVLKDVNRSIMFISIANCLWLALGIASAIAIGFYINRSLGAVYTSLARLVETLTAMSAEIAGYIASHKPAAEDGGSRSQAGEAADLASGADESDDGEAAGAPGPIPAAAAVAVAAEATAAAVARRAGHELEEDEPHPALQLRMRELARFQPLLEDAHARFAYFQRKLYTEAQLRLETRARAAATRTFLATMSHEMRTPLNGILGMIDLALENPGVPEPVVEYLEAAAHCGDHLFLLISDLLDFQRMQAGLLPLRGVPFDVRDSVRAAVHLVEIQAKAKTIPVEVALDGRIPPTLVSDPDRLRQVLVNLLSNALKYSSAGTVRVRGRLRAPAAAEASPPKVCVEFEVEDSGIGIPAEAVPNIFTPFFRAHSSSSGEDPGGTGLGLSISRDLVKRAGGELTFQSEVGKGSTFRFTWPFSLPEGEAGTALPGAELELLDGGAGRGRLAIGRHAPPSPATARAGRVLVVDDDEINRKMLHAVLRHGGHDVRLACDGAKAVDAFRAAAEAAAGCGGGLVFDAILMDCSMPVMDGFGATRAIRALEAERGLARTPVWALTAHGEAEDEQNCLACGMDCFLTKPVRKAVLLAKLEALLVGAAAHAAAAAAAAAAPQAAAPEAAPPPAPSCPPPAASGETSAVPPERPPAPAGDGGAPAAAHAAAAPSGAPQAPSELPEPPPKLEVLVVDDIEMNRRVLRGLIQKEGHSVETAGDGEEAVASFAARARAGRPFALIFMDIQMPRLDGLGAARRIRELEREAAAPRPTPIVACTAYADEQSAPALHPEAGQARRAGGRPPATRAGRAARAGPGRGRGRGARRGPCRDPGPVISLFLPPQVFKIKLAAALAANAF